MQMRFLITAFLVVAVQSVVVAQANVNQRDTLCRYPFFHNPYLHETGDIGDSVQCTVCYNWGEKPFFGYGYTEEGLPFGTPYNYDIHDIPAAYGYPNDTTLKVLGVAVKPVMLLQYADSVILYDENMNILGSVWCDRDFWQSDPYSDTTCHFFFIPGIVNQSRGSNRCVYSILNYVPGEYGLFFYFFDEPVYVKGNYYLEPREHSHYASDCSTIVEYHDPPYHFSPIPLRIKNGPGGTWTDTVVYRIVPPMFLIIERECHDVEGVRIMWDEWGCLNVSWDSSERQTQWVLELTGPDGVRLDTVDSCRHSYCGLDGMSHYDVRLRAQCVQPGARTWSNWTESYPTGNLSADEVVDGEHRLTLWPNPAEDYVDVDLGGGAWCMEGGELTVVDGAGRVVMRESVKSGEGRHRLSTASLPHGSYHVRLTSPEGVFGRTLLVK